MKRPILYVAIPFCLGIAFSRFFKIPITYPVILCAISLLITLLISRPGLSPVYLSTEVENILSHILLYLAVFFFGMAAYQNSVELPADHIAHFVQDAPQKVIVRGVVADDPVTGPALYGKKKTVFTLKADVIDRMGKIGTVPQVVDAIAAGTVPIFPRDDGHYSWHGASGLVKISAYSDKGAQVSFGDELILEGMLSKPHGLKNPGVFDYDEYLASKDIYAVLCVKEDSLIKRIDSRSGGFRLRQSFGGQVNLRYGRGDRRPGLNPAYHIRNLWDNLQISAYKLRHAIKGTIDRHLPPTYGGFMKAILVGDRSGLDENMKDDFVKTGTVHVLAISGLHVGFISGILIGLFFLVGMPKKINFVLSAVVLIFYSIVAGASPPIIRAVMIFCVLVVGRLIDRDADLLNSLAFAAFVMLLWKPRELFDPSFQLSFVSVAGIIIFTPRIEAAFRLDSIRGSSAVKKSCRCALKAVSVSIAAWLGTWPFIASYFNIISPVSLIANLIVIPILFLLTAFSLIFLSAAAISGFFAKALAYMVCMAEGALFGINKVLADLPFSYFRIGSPPIVFAVLYYVFIFALFLPGAFRLGRIRIEKMKIVAGLVVFFNIIIWSDLLIGSNRRGLMVTFFDVGHGDSILMELPGSNTVLIDGGSGGQADAFDAGRSVVAPCLWNKRVSYIDVIIVTHFHEDHMGGILYILNNFEVGTVIDNGAVPQNEISKDYLETIRKKGVRRIAVGEGDEIGPIGGSRFFVLNPEKGKGISDPRARRNENNDSIVLKVVYKNFSMLLCGDITDEPVKRLTGRYGKFLKSDIMKVPHHGGGFKDERVVENFFGMAAPEISVISAGIINSEETPSRQASRIIAYLSSNSYNTKTYGCMTIFSDGSRFGIRFPMDKKNRLFCTLP